jgi:NADH-quinone oxidoreductase subunit J
MTLEIGILLVLAVAAGLWTMVVTGLLRSAVGLAVTSAVVAALMYELGSPLAALFELSVCAGLITVVLVSAISLTEHFSKPETKERGRERFKRFALLPVIVVVTAVVLIFVVKLDFDLAAPVSETMTVNQFMWNERTFDLLGQVVIILTGILGVIVLFKERSSHKLSKSGE